MRQTFYERNNVPVFHAKARLPAPNTIEIDEKTRIQGVHTGQAISVDAHLATDPRATHN